MTGEDIVPYIEKTITAGKTKEITKYHTFRCQSPKRPRGKNIETTVELKRKINERNAETKLRILLNANFKENDLYLTLTYRSCVPDQARAKNNLVKFIRKLRDLYKKSGVLLKYIAVTEYSNKRIHHHLLINKMVGIGKRDIEKVWGFGFQKVELFGGDPGDCQRLASYFIKESNSNFKTDESVHRLRWIASKNLIRPVPIVREVSACSWGEDPKPIKGYYIDEVIKGFDLYEYQYQFYRLIKINDDSKFKKNE